MGRRLAALTAESAPRYIYPPWLHPRRSEIRPEPDDEPAPLLTPAVFHILLALADGESHGYGIMQDVERFTNGDTRLGPGTLYRSIQRMLVDGLIEELAISLHDEADEDRRRYYRLTAKGLAGGADARRGGWPTWWTPPAIAICCPRGPVKGHA